MTANLGHSVFERLKAKAKKQGEDFNLILVRYAMERLIYRLSISAHADNFVLKGASLFLVWKGQNYRVTRDTDFLSLRETDLDILAKIFAEVCEQESAEDGASYDPGSIEVAEIREGKKYHGLRVTLKGRLYNARIPLQIDIGFGDAITPGPETIEFPPLLDAPAPRMLAYPRYTVVAEKLEAMVDLDLANTRMKDFYDVWVLRDLFEFDGALLAEAIRQTFKRRGTTLPAGRPFALTDEFAKDADKTKQWIAFVKKAAPVMPPPEFGEVTTSIAEFLDPVLESLRANQIFKKHWPSGGPWG